MKAEYKKRHDEIWPSLVALLREAGVADYSIHLDEDTNILFGVLWRRDDHGMADLPKHPVMQRWWRTWPTSWRPGRKPTGGHPPGNNVPYGMSALRHIAVIDIGKTNAKVALVDLVTLSEVGLRRMANAPLRQAPYPHHDVESLWRFILNSLASLNREQRIEAISITTHGATGVLVDAAGELVLPVLDYEFDGPDRLATEYSAIRPPFIETGTPRLPLGLNLGAQFFWLEKRFPTEFARAAAMLMYPQYWALRLTGVAANEVTSLGCHTDLWSPWEADFSSMVDRLDWRRLMAPVRPARDQLGPILPALAARTGLDPQTPVFCGLHDSNASLLPHLLSDEPPFSVVSTGTWVVSMAVGGREIALDAARDTLVNVSALGDPVPSARFMGGREFSQLTKDKPQDCSGSEVLAVLTKKMLLLPSTQQGSGPFPHHAAAWLGAEGISKGERFAA
ncbi:L-rhamnose mutarotase, partial [Mesorhizobium sp. C277A]|uniref:L-rhamnose mutarotase n=1 Tax=Mesorhizobium sp. C277A TaxID=2956827 RepID=UPI003338E7B3